MRAAFVCLALFVLMSLSVVAQGTADWKFVDEGIMPPLSVCNDAVRVDSLRAYIVGGTLMDQVPGSITRTLDGGRTWQLMEYDPGFAYHAISFLDDTRALILCEETEPGGQSREWLVRRLTPSDTAGEAVLRLKDAMGLPPKWHGCFPNGTAYVSVHYRYGSILESGRAVLRTRDYGATWDTACKVPNPGNTVLTLFQFDVFIPTSGVVHAIFAAKNDRLSHVLSSYDDGKNWKRSYEHTMAVNPDILGGFQTGKKFFFFPFPDPNVALLFFQRTDSVLKIDLGTGSAEVHPFRVAGLLKQKRAASSTFRSDWPSFF